MAIRMQQGNLPHIFWIDLKSDGVYTECAVMKKDQFDNVYYFPLTALDNIDKRRLQRILTNRNATHFELWDLMSNITLNNGVNALTYFHQLVQVLTPGGQVMNPRTGVVGIGDGGTIDTRDADNRKQMEEYANLASKAAAEAAAAAAAQVFKGNYGQNTPSPEQVAQPAPPKKKTSTSARSKKTNNEE